MKIGIFSHCTIDTIVYENEQYETAGGPASYCSYTARKQKHDVNLYTKFGTNYPLEDFFKENNIIAHDAVSAKFIFSHIFSRNNFLSEPSNSILNLVVFFADNAS